MEANNDIKNTGSGDGSICNNQDSSDQDTQCKNCKKSAEDLAATDNSKLTFWELVRKERKNIFILALPFVLMDVFIKILCADVNYFQFASIVPNILFSVSWDTLLTVILIISQGTVP